MGRTISTTSQIMGKCVKIASFISGIIGLIWSTFIIAVCAGAFNHWSDIQDFFAKEKNVCDELSKNSKYWKNCYQYFLGKWSVWLIFAICLVSICKFMASLALLYGIKERKASFVKCWLIVKIIDISLLFLAFLCVLGLIIYASNLKEVNDEFKEMIEFSRKLNAICNGIILTLLLLCIFVKICVRYMVSKVHKDLKKGDKEEKSLNKQFAHILHHDDVEIEKANGKYITF